MTYWLIRMVSPLKLRVLRLMKLLTRRKLAMFATDIAAQRLPLELMPGLRLVRSPAQKDALENRPPANRP